MKTHGVICNEREVLANLSGVRTMTREVMRPQPAWISDQGIPMRDYDTDYKPIVSPLLPGDQFYMRETWIFRGTTWKVVDDHETARVEYLADRWIREVRRPHGIDYPPHPTKPKNFNKKYLSRYSDLIERGDEDCANESAWSDFLDDWWKMIRSPAIMPAWAARPWRGEVLTVKAERLQEITTEDIIKEGFSSKLREYDAECDLQSRYIRDWELRHGLGSWDCNDYIWVSEYKGVKP